MTRFQSTVTAVVLAVAIVFLSAALAESASAASCSGADKSPRRISSKTAGKAIVCLINKKRRSHGLKPLKSQRNLTQAARAHTRRMQRSNCFSHACPGEAVLSGRYARSDYLPCGCRWGAAENIAWGPNHDGSPRKIVKAWMRSSEHRHNILGPFDHVGAGVKWGSPTSRHANAGTYTVDFGYRR